MAEVVAFRNNALPYPVRGMAWVVEFPLLDADGDPVSPSSPDSEVSLNGDTFGDCTNEAVEIATSTGVCYLILTAAEMTADVVGVRIQSTGAKTTVITLFPRKLVALSSGTCQGSNDTGDIQLASGDSAIDDYYNGCLVVAVIDGTTEARIINDYVGSTKVAEVSPAWNTAQPDSSDTYTIYLPEGRQFALSDERAMNGDKQSTADLKDFADDGYDPSTNKVAGVVLVDTLTTYTGNTVQTGDSYAIVNSGTHGNAAIKGYVDDIGVAGAGLTAADDAILTAIAALNNIAAADVWAVATRVLTAGTNIQLPSNGLANISAWTVAITGNITGNLSGSVGSIATGGIVAASFGAGAIDAAAIATDAFGALELAAGAGSEIASAVRTELTTELARIDAAVSTRATPAQVNAEVLDVMNVDTLIDGKTFVQSQQYVSAVVLGRISGAGTGTEVFKGLDESTTRVTITVDSVGNRTDVAYG